MSETIYFGEHFYVEDVASALGVPVGRIQELIREGVLKSEWPGTVTQESAERYAARPGDKQSWIDCERLEDLEDAAIDEPDEEEDEPDEEE
jgi:hypothetical protein